MQSENFDKKIKDSLSQRPPGNDIPDWDKMETLLDKHMPVEKKDRRRIFFILFSFLLLGGGAFLVWQNSNSNKKEVAEIKSPIQKSATKENNKPGNTGTEKSTSTSRLPNNTIDRPASSQDTDPQTNAVNNTPPGKEIKTSTSIAKADKNKKTNTTVYTKTGNSKQKNSDQKKEKFVKETKTKKLMNEKLNKREKEPKITEKKELVKE